MNETKNSNRLVKFGVNLFFFLFIFGLIGSTVVMWQHTGVRPDRPDLNLKQYLQDNPPAERYAVKVARYRNEILSVFSPEDAVNNKTLFSLGRVGDLFTSHAVMIIHDRFGLDFDEPISAWSTGFSSEIAALTPAQLMTHTSGLPAGDYDVLIDGSPTCPVPGQESLYSKANYDILQALIADITGLPYETFVTQELLLPLGMEQTKWFAADTQDRGSWFSTPEDLYLFQEIQATNLAVLMKTGQRASTAAKLDKERRGDFGFGWKIEPNRGLRMEWLAHQDENALALIIRYPEKNFGMVILGSEANQDIDPAKLAKDAVGFYLGREMRPLPSPES